MPMFLEAPQSMKTATEQHRITLKFFLCVSAWFCGYFEIRSDTVYFWIMGSETFPFHPL